MVKRLFAILLCIVMLSQVVYSVDFYTDSDSKSFDLTVGLLDSVNIIELNGDTDMATTVTKGEFLKSAVRLFLGGRQDFSALDYNQYIELLGVDVDEITVNADNKVTYSYAVKAIVKGLGYDTLVKNNDYYSMAIQIGLVNNVSYKENQFITLEQQIKLFDNALNIKVMRMIKTGEYVKSMENTGILLEEVLKLQKRKGIVTGTHKTPLFGKTVLHEGEIMIGDVIYQTETDYSDSLGMNVEFYVALDKEDNTLVYLYENARKNDLITLDYKELIDYKGNKYTYWNDNNKKETVELAKPFYTIYNGFAASDLKRADMIPSYGNVKLIDNDKNGLYDVVIITDYIIGKANVVNEKEEVIYVETFDGNEKINLSNYDNYELYNHEGSKARYSVINKDDILLIKLSRGNHYAYVGKVGSVINGSLDSYSIKGGIYEIVVDGTAYETTEKSIIDNLEVGNTYSFYIDNGNVVGMLQTSGDTEYVTGYLINIALDNMFQDTLDMKIFTEDGVMLITKTATKVKLDNHSGRNAIQVNQALCDASGGFTPQLIRYRLDGEGNVNVIDTPYNHTQNYRDAEPGQYETKDSFRVVYSSTLDGEGSVYRYNSMGTYGAKFILNGKYSIFQIPSSPATAEDDDFRVTSASTDGFYSELNSTSYSVEAYSFDGSEVYADVIVGFGGKGVTKNDNCRGVITSITKTIDKDGNEVECLTIQGPPGYHVELLNYLYQGSIPKYYDNSGPRSYKYDVGDFVWVQWHDKEIEFLSMIYDVETGYYYGNNAVGGSWSIGGYHAVFKGSVLKKEGNAILVTDKIITPNLTNKEAAANVFVPSQFSLRRVSKVGGKMKYEVCTENELVDYMSSPNDYSEVLIYTSSGYAWLMVIYDI